MQCWVCRLCHIIMQPYSMLLGAAAASGQHVAATASSCRSVLLKPSSEKKLSLEHVFMNWKVGH
jgi:hypothetical protein